MTCTVTYMSNHGKKFSKEYENAHNVLTGIRVWHINGVFVFPKKENIKTDHNKMKIGI